MSHRRRPRRYAHARSLDHAERILLKQARTAREAAGEDNTPASAALRGKAHAYVEAAQLIAVLRRKFADGELDEAKR